MLNSFQGHMPENTISYENRMFIQRNSSGNYLKYQLAKQKEQRNFHVAQSIPNKIKNYKFLICTQHDYKNTKKSTLNKSTFNKTSSILPKSIGGSLRNFLKTSNIDQNERCQQKLFHLQNADLRQSADIRKPSNQYRNVVVRTRPQFLLKKNHVNPVMATKIRSFVSERVIQIKQDNFIKLLA